MKSTAPRKKPAPAVALRPDGKASQTRRKILDAAASDFATRGFKPASLNEIAAAASMKGGSLYFHFASKDVLIGEVLREGVVRTMELVQEAVDALGAGSTARERVCAAVGTHVEALHGMATYAAAVLRIVEEVSPETRETFREHERAYAHYWDELVTQAQQAGCFVPQADPRDVRQLLFGAMNATATRRSDRAVDVPAQTALVLALFRLDEAAKPPPRPRPPRKTPAKA